MKELYELKDKLCDELKEYGKKEMSSGNLDVIDKLAHALKNLEKIIENRENEEYSNYSMEYPMGRSYARRRDSRGRYSSRGYSYHGNDIEELKMMMESAPNEAIRQDYRRIIEKMESM